MGVSDEQAIRNLLYRYGYLIDAGDFQGIGELFQDAVLTSDTGGMEVSGADAIAKHYASTTRIYPDTGTPKTKHVFTNMWIEGDDTQGVATSKTNYIVFQQTDELPLSRSSPATTTIATRSAATPGASCTRSSTSTSSAT